MGCVVAGVNIQQFYSTLSSGVRRARSLSRDDDNYYDMPARPPTDRAVADRNILFVRSRDMRETFTTIINWKCCAKLPK